MDMHTRGRDDSSIADGGDVVSVECEPDESTTRAVLRGIAAMKGISETEFDPLYEQIEFDALEGLVGHASRRDRSLSVRFPLDDYTVCVREDGRVRIVDGSHPLALEDGS